MQGNCIINLPDWLHTTANNGLKASVRRMLYAKMPILRF